MPRPGASEVPPLAGKALAPKELKGASQVKNPWKGKEAPQKCLQIAPRRPGERKG